MKEFFLVGLMFALFYVLFFISRNEPDEKKSKDRSTSSGFDLPDFGDFGDSGGDGGGD